MDRRIRICQMITELGPAGAERCVYELARRLDPARFDVGVLALRGGEVAGWLAREGVPVRVMDLRGRWDVAAMGRIVSLLRRWKPDILHTHLFHADLVGRTAAWLAGVPRLIHTVHVAEARFRPWQFAWARMAAGACDRIVCVSDDVCRHHAARSGLPRSCYEVIPNGIDVEAFAPDLELRRRLRGRWGVPEERCLLAYLGRLDPQKGTDVLVSALSHLGARQEAVDLVIAGDGPLRWMIENYTAVGEGGDRCRHLGFVHDVRGLLSAADVLVLPSRWEGFGLAAAEAMAAGIPVLGTRVPGLRQVVCDGQTGLLVAPEDVPALADAMLRLATNQDLRVRLGEAALERVRRQFDIRRNTALHAALYSRVMEQGRTAE